MRKANGVPNMGNQPQVRIRQDLREQGAQEMGRYVSWRGRMGDGPERGNIRIERLLREEAMMGAKAILGSRYCSGV